jgi:hypothetical protein
MRAGNLTMKCVVIMTVSCLSALAASSQTLLPHISVYYENGKNHITWISSYTGIKQIGVQRSQDSLVNYATIGYAKNPGKKENEYVDAHAVAGKNYYRLFILMDNNAYFFSDPATISMKPVTLKTQPPPSVPQVFSPSIFVYTNADGNVNISLAGAPESHYDIRFFDSDDHFLFAIRDIRKPLLILDKSNFLRAGWYHYELYENGKIKEKWKFYIGDSVDK